MQVRLSWNSDDAPGLWDGTARSIKGRDAESEGIRRMQARGRDVRQQLAREYLLRENLVLALVSCRAASGYRYVLPRCSPSSVTLIGPAANASKGQDVGTGLGSERYCGWSAG